MVDGVQQFCLADIELDLFVVLLEEHLSYFVALISQRTDNLKFLVALLCQFLIPFHAGLDCFADALNKLESVRPQHLSHLLLHLLIAGWNLFQHKRRHLLNGFHQL